MSAGYSGTPLVQKLGIKEGFAIAILNAPDGYDSLLGPLPSRVTVARGLEGDLDFIQLFTTERADLVRELPKLKARTGQNGMIWVSWPKRTSKLQTDLGDDVVRKVGLDDGLVDVKVCAIDETWSALKFVRRLKDRGSNLHPKSRKA